MSMSPMLSRVATNDRQRLRGVGLDVLADPRPAEADAADADRVRRHDAAVFGREELIARDEVARELRIVRGQELVGIVERVAGEELRAGRRSCSPGGPARSARRRV